MIFRRKLMTTAIVVLLLTMIIGFNAAVYFLYNEARQSLELSLGSRLLSIARAVSPEIEAEVENDLQLGDLSLATFSRLRSYFDRLSEADDLSGIHLIGIDDRDLLSWDDSLSLIELYLPLHQQQLDQARLGSAVVSELYSVDQRYFKSAFYPVGSDSVVAVMVVESGFPFFEDFRSFKENMIIVNLIAAAFLILVGGLILLLNRKLVRAEKLLISQAALSQMGQMAAVIAHEVRNPLAIIKASAERIKKRYGADSDDELFDFIPEEVDRLDGITRRYLQFAAPTASREQREPLATIVTSVTEGLAREFADRQVELSVEVSQTGGQLMADSSRLRQVLVNLLRNALEAVTSGGRVTLTVGEVAGSRCALMITDNGSGLSRRELANIFDPFYTTKSKGSGLGLFVVRRLVDELGGTLDVKSEMGVGTSFTINLAGTDDG